MSENRLKVGEQAPDFQLLDDRGNQFKLSDLRGKKVILYFYPKDDTPGCTKQACQFRDHIGELSQLGAVVIGISPDPVESHVKFKEKYNLPFTLLSDPEHKVAEAYGVWRERTIYGKKKMGIVRSQFIIDENGTLIDVKYRIKPDQSVPRAQEILSK